MNYCIPKDLIDKLKPEMKALGGAKLVSMSKEELTTFFSKTVGAKLGGEVATSFRKAALSHNKSAMKEWAKKTLTPEEAKKAGEIADSLTEDDKVFEAIDGDVIERVLGVEITPEEVDEINRLTKKMEDAYNSKVDNIYTGVNTDYFRAEKELNDYLDTVNPMSNLEVVSRIIFRGTLLFAPKSIVTNVIGNTMGGISEKIVNAAIERKFSGVNADLIKGYIQYSAKVYTETGIDVVRTMNMTSHTSVLGEHYKGVGTARGAVRAYGRWIEQYVFRYGQGTPDIAFASLHFADNVNVLTTKVADAKRLTGDAHKAEARRLFLLATSLNLDENNPDHAEAVQIKQLALQYALTATYQNDTQWSKNALAIRNSLDDYTGVLHLGTNTIPFIKTLVNIAKLSVDMTGITLPIEVPRLIYAYNKGDVETIRATINVCVRAGFGLFLAYLLAGLFDDDDYLPDYTIASPYQKQVAKLANASYNSIRIGNKWVSLTYFGTFGYALAGMLGARQKQDFSGKVLSYYSNTLMQIRQTPVIQQVADTLQYLYDAKQYNKTGEDVKDEAISGVANFFLSRTIPSISSDIAKAVDDKERYLRYGVEGIPDQLKNKIPFWREVLPPKYSGLGDTIPTEAFYWTILAGARFKTAPPDTAVYNELVRLSVSGEDVKVVFSGNKDLVTAKKLLTPTEYNELNGLLQKSLTNTYANIMSTQKYKDETDPEKKKKYLMDSRDGILQKALKDAGYFTRIKEEQKLEKKNK